MSETSFHVLTDRSVVALSGEDALPWLDNLVAGDLTALGTAPVVFTVLLSPQGKVLFEFFVWKTDNGLLLDVSTGQADALVKRLRMYKLRSRVDFRDATGDWAVIWQSGGGSIPDGAIVAVDPRANGGLQRGLCVRSKSAFVADAVAYTAARVKLGIGEAPDDYSLGDVFPHEANMDLSGGVSFSKGCYVGQEVVSRMQNKTVVRKRVVRVTGDGPLVHGAEANAGDAAIGRIGSVAGSQALAMLRLDRVVEALDGGGGISSGGRAIRVDPAALDRYRQSVKDKPVIDL